MARTNTSIIFSVVISAILLSLLFPPLAQAAGIAKTDWPTWGGNSAHNKISPSKHSGPLTVYLRIRETPTTTYHNLGPVVANGKIYVVTEDKGRWFSGNDENYLVSYDLSGKRLWSTPLPSGERGNGSNPLTVADDGTIYFGMNDGLMAFNSNGSIKYHFILAGGNSLACPTYARMPVLDSVGRVILQTGNGGDLYACDPASGLRIWRTNYFSAGGGQGNGGVAIDSQDIAYFHSQRGTKAIRTADGSEVWGNSSVATTITWNNYALSQDEQLLAISNSGSASLTILNAKTGRLLWYKGLGTQNGVFTFGRERIYVSADTGGGVLGFKDSVAEALGMESTGDSEFQGALCALEPQTGRKIWCVKTLSHAEQSNMAVDSDNSVFATGIGRREVYGFKKDGSTLFTYTDTEGILGESQAALTDDGKLFVGLYYLYGFRPWTLSSTAVKKAQGKETQIEFTVKSSMLRRDPQEGVSADNQAQVVLDGGQIVPLHYLHQDGDDSVWTGRYILPAGTDPSTINLKGSVEAIAYNTQSSIVTHFSNLPSGFQNTGMSQAFDLGTIASLGGTSVAVDKSSPSFLGSVGQFFKGLLLPVGSFSKSLWGEIVGS